MLGNVYQTPLYIHTYPTRFWPLVEPIEVAHTLLIHFSKGPQIMACYKRILGPLTLSKAREDTLWDARCGPDLWKEHLISMHAPERLCCLPYGPQPPNTVHPRCSLQSVYLPPMLMCKRQEVTRLGSQPAPCTKALRALNAPTP